MKRQIFRLTLAYLAAAALCSAGTIVYNVAQTVGTDTVRGTITTDGTNGLLARNNYLGWDLVIGDGVTQFELKQSNSVAAAGFLASPSALSFNFNGDGMNYVLFRNITSDGSYYWGLQQANIGFGITTAAEFINVSPGAAGQQFTNLSGLQVFATAQSAVSPEPSTFGLLLGGAAILALRRRGSK
jgi:hypothetical protein